MKDNYNKELYELRVLLVGINKKLDSFIVHQKTLFSLDDIATLLNLSKSALYMRMKKANLEPEVEKLKINGIWHLNACAIPKLKGLRSRGRIKCRKI